MDERVVLALVFARQILIDIKISDRAGDPRRVVAGVEVIDLPDLGDTVANVRPGVIQSAANR